MPELCIHGLQAVGKTLNGCVLTIGNFDGVHLGHRKIIAQTRAIANSAPRKPPVVVLTFEPPPDLVLKPADEPRRVIPPALKCKLLNEAGADCVVVAASDKCLLEMSPEKFIDEILAGVFAPSHVVEGHDFFFGRKRSGNIQTLRDHGKRLGFEVHEVEPAMVQLPSGPARVSSTLIRNLVMEGKVDQAALCLGRPFELFGDVIKGSGRGRSFNFPTANLRTAGQVLPADGIYAGEATIGGRTYAAAVSIGTNPTVGPAPRAVEAHLIDAAGDFYGMKMELRFIARLREQRRFPNTQALAEQIAKDVQRVREIAQR